MHTPVSSRERILDSAAYLLRHRGLAGAKLGDIAERTGMLAPSLYHHFRSKEDLVEAVLVEGVYRNTRHIVAQVEVLGPDADALERLKAAVRAHVRFLVVGDDYSSAVPRVFQDLPDEIRRRVLAAYTGFDNYWRDLILAAQQSGLARGDLDATVVRKFLLAMLDSSSSWYRPGKLGPDEIADQACALFLSGFAAPARS